MLYSNDNETDHNDKYVDASSEYLKRAKAAANVNDNQLAIHLYLAAYFASSNQVVGSSTATIRGLRTAWDMAFDLHDVDLLKYTLSVLEPYLSDDEIPLYVEQIRDQSATYGSSSLEDIELAHIDTDSLRQLAHELLASGEVYVSDDFNFTEFLNLIEDKEAKSNLDEDVDEDIDEESEQLDLLHEEALKEADRFEDEEQLSADLKVIDASKSDEEPKLDSSEWIDRELSKMKKIAISVGSKKIDTDKKTDQKPKPARLSYDGLVGFDTAIESMRTLGIVSRDNEEFQELVDKLNELYGVSSMPSHDTILFCSESQDDVNLFALATAGEIGLPTISVSIDSDPRGLSVLRFSAHASDVDRVKSFKNGFTGPGVLVIENLDDWNPAALVEMMEGNPEVRQAGSTRMPREPLSIIYSAIENPEVYVFATASSASALDPMFERLLGPLTVVEVGLPTEGERQDIWFSIVEAHPSVAVFDMNEIVKLSNGISRLNIYACVSSVLKDAYRKSLDAREFLPISEVMIYEKMAEYLDPDTEEYKIIENKVAQSFRDSLTDIDSLLTGE